MRPQVPVAQLASEGLVATVEPESDQLLEQRRRPHVRVVREPLTHVRLEPVEHVRPVPGAHAQLALS
jgi:hypothetical protein